MYGINSIDFFKFDLNKKYNPNLLKQDHMKVYPVEKIREADAYTIANEPISSIDLMERASKQLFKWIKKNVKKYNKILVFAGPGNNGGDGLALSRMLLNDNYEVVTYIIKFSDKVSDDFSTNYKRLEETSGSVIISIEKEDDMPEINNNAIVIDAIFGSGLARPVTGMTAKLISIINASNAITIAVDMPSGLFSDSSSVGSKGEIIQADYTLSFQFPKLAFLVAENEMYVGNWIILDIGLSNEFIELNDTKNQYIVKQDLLGVRKGRPRYSHKGTFGHALIIAGSYGKMGAAVLASKACLRSGVGLLHTHIPKSGITILQTSTPETMLSIDRYENYFSEVPDLTMFNAIGIGPGLGKEKQSQMAMKLLIQNASVPIVFDADALNILAENLTWLAFLPPGSVLTPHPKEFKRIVGGWKNDFEKLEKQRSLAAKHNIYVVLKGANTTVCFPDGSMFFNSTGNPGMATAGSGDVLTGIITGLIASGYTSGIASILGVYLHGLAGDYATKKLGAESVIASDIINNLGKAFKSLK